MVEGRLTSLEQLHRNATECIRLAEEAGSSAHRLFFVQMAERWLTLAELAEERQKEAGR